MTPACFPRNPLDFTRFRVTFKQPGVYKYICALHDNLGMVGTVVVEPSSLPSKRVMYRLHRGCLGSCWTSEPGP